MDKPIVISGGQTGVDRAALDAARQANLKTGGWCPRGRLAEDGIIPERYVLRETPAEDYSVRTEWNARDSDATLAVTRGEPSGGTAYALECASKHGKPYLTVDVRDPTAARKIADWLQANKFKRINVAGPRESACPGIYESAKALLFEAFTIFSGREYPAGPDAS